MFFRYCEWLLQMNASRLFGVGNCNEVVSGTSAVKHMGKGFGQRIKALYILAF